MITPAEQKYALTKKQAQQFLLRKHGLLGEPIFHGKEGILAFVKQVSCIQYDPIDVCGRNADLVLFSRIQGYTKTMLAELLYQDRALLDYFDKNLAIIPMAEWPSTYLYRQRFQQKVRSLDEIQKIVPYIKEEIKQRGPLCSKDLALAHKVDWYWGATRLSRAALEAMYFQGDLVIHHKVRTQKYYALAQDVVPSALLAETKEWENHQEYINQKVLQRIEAAGFLWNKPSDAFLGVIGIKTLERKTAFATLANRGDIIELVIDGISEPCWMRSADLPILAEVMQDHPWQPRVEFLAPLDNMLWDRKLIRAVFGFDYKWEIYTPEKDRKYGYYTLPMISQDGFIGRIEVVQNRKQQCVLDKNIWLEDNAVLQVAKLEETIQRMANFLDCRHIAYHDAVQSLLQMKRS